MSVVTTKAITIPFVSMLDAHVIRRACQLAAIASMVACSGPNQKTGDGEDGGGGRDGSVPTDGSGHGSSGSAGSGSGSARRGGVQVRASSAITRPANEDDTAHYPTAIITKIWQDIAATDADFAVSTGDYQFSNPSNSQAAAQLALYATARAAFPGKLYAAMGNHECTGYTASNCGSGNTDGITNNYTAFTSKLLAPINQTLPYYSVRFDASDGSYTAKLVVIAANAWDSTQATWLDSALAVQTTYTFVVRHEDRTANTAPGVTPSETIIKKYPLTMRIVGHTHTYTHYASDKEVVCGNGGAPLTSGTNYGYGVVERLSDGNVQFTEYDYENSTVIDTFKVTPSGDPAQ